MSAPPPDPLATPLTALWGVGPDRVAQLARLGLHTVGELLLHRPRRYEDRRRFLPIKQIAATTPVLARGTVVACGLKYFKQRTGSVFELILDDGTARLHCRWWNLPFMENYFAVGDEVMVFGRPVSLKPRTIDHPETEVVEAGEESSIHLNRIAPVYPLTEGLPQRWLRGLVWRTLEKFGRQVPDAWPQLAALPARAEFRLREGAGTPQAQAEACGFRQATYPARAGAIQWLHFPEELADAELARQRLALDEFVGLQLSIQQRRQRLLANATGLPCAGNNQLIKPFLARLGFTLTTAQTKVLRELRHALASGRPMRRLLQGDVGSGKTAVAACAALMAIESGRNVALMAPTEILAEQHSQTFRRWLDPLGVPVRLRTASHKEGEGGPELPLHGARNTEHAALTIGTHALLESSVTFENLGLVIIDEQHKFGVTQRERLVRKGRYPHLLVMTATPIPRTLGLTLYGDLDVSVIDELPGGRGVIKTYVRTNDKLPKVWAFVCEQLAAGRQAYVVYPRVEEGDLRTGVKAVTQELEKLRAALAPHRVGLLHGRMRSEEKEQVMAGFRANQVQVLLATSVIEVGVDVPNATIMVVENAEQFGLAQLHQLRGRIGRGAHDSWCILVADQKTDDAKARLKVLAETCDGFRIAEADLRLRGPGELLGQAQSGVPAFRFADLAEDLPLIEQAREFAATLLAL